MESKRELGNGTGTTISLLQQAADQALHFQFSEAAKNVESYLRMIPGTDLRGRGDALRKISFYRYKAALQSNDNTTFQLRIKGSLPPLKEAEECFERLGKPAKADLLRSRAFESYLDYWIAKDPVKKRNLLDKSWSLAKKALEGYGGSKRDLEYAETFDQLSLPVGISLESDWRLASRIKKSKEAVEHGKRAIQILRLARRKDDLTRALVRTALFLDALSENTLEGAKAPRIQQEALELWNEAQTISKELSYQETSRPPQGFHRILDQTQALEISKEALRLVEPQQDKFANGWLTEKLAKWSFYAAEARENAALRTKGHVEALHYAEEAAKNYDIINFTSAGGGVLWVHSPYAEHFYQLATYENDPIRRRLLQEKSLRNTPELLRLAKQSRHPPVVSYGFHIGSKSAVTLAEIETNKKRKIRLLREGLRRREEAIKVTRMIEGPQSWNRGIMLRYLADNQARLADLADTPEQQKELLEQAILSQEEGLEAATEHVQSFERIESHVFRGPLGRYHFEHATVLQRLNSLTGDQEYLRRAAQEYSVAADLFEKAGRPSGAAECYWKSAETHDSLQAYSLASENFLLAAKAYETLGKNTPPLSELALDYARYLNAWSKIELARSMHQTLRYDSAARAYNNAALLHRSSKRWGFLAHYYRAWSRLESGENLSRNGHRRKAIEAFRKATGLFAESTILLKDQLARLEQTDEKKMVSILVNTPKKDYSTARITLEEAIIAESREDYRTSFEKFGLASEKLREVSERSELKQDRDETGFLSTLCRAWQHSSKAELEDSVDLLQKAETYFGEAREMSPSQSAKKLAQGHEEFCKALIASRQFADSLDPELHKEASRHLDLASGYYLDAGFKTAADHALGRKLLLDAFAQLNEANNEEDPKKKAGLYLATSSLLRESTSAFRRARQPRKMERARDLLKQTRIESKIASQLTAILDAALEAPTNVAFHTPAQGNERPVGLNRFDRADIEVRLSKIERRPSPGKEIELQFEITNTGKQPVGLVRIDDAIPDGTELKGDLDKWKIEGRSMIPLQSLRVNMLQTEPMKLVLRVQEEGIIRIGPKIIFEDAGTTKHERTMEPKIIATSKIMEFLTNSFVKDYASRRLAITSCGWRTLMEIVQDLKIPRSHVYGEPRYGRTFGRQLDALVKSSIVEYRIFPGERGRGGDITKVRVQLTNRDVRGYLEEQVPGLGLTNPINEAVSRLDDQKMAPQITISP